MPDSLVADRWRRLEGILSRVDMLLMGIACLMLFVIMVLVSADAILRYAFNRPIAWSYDLVALYLLVAVFYLSLSGTLKENYHVSVDIFLYRFSPRLRHACEAIANLIAACVFLAICYLAAGKATTSYVTGEALKGVIDWPTWIPSALVAAGSLMIALRSLLNALGHALSFATRRSVAPLPPLAGEQFAAGE